MGRLQSRQSNLSSAAFLIYGSASGYGTTAICRGTYSDRSARSSQHYGSWSPGSGSSWMMQSGGNCSGKRNRITRSFGAGGNSRMTKLQIISRLWSSVYDLLFLVKGTPVKSLEEIERDLDLIEFHCRRFADDDVELP